MKNLLCRTKSGPACSRRRAVLDSDAADERRGDYQTGAAAAAPTHDGRREGAAGQGRTGVVGTVVSDAR